MRRRNFLLGTGSVIASASFGISLIPSQANAFAITLASVSKMAAIGRDVIKFLGGGSSDPTAALTLENHRLLVAVHERLDDIEKTLIEIVEKIDDLPARLREELDSQQERILTTRVLGLVRAHAEALDEFEVARSGENADAAYERLIAEAVDRKARLTELRGELSYYSDFAAIALIGLAATELSLSILSGAEPSEKVALRRFYADQKNRVFDLTRPESLASILTRARLRQSEVENRLSRMLSGFPETGDGGSLATGSYLGRCHTFGLPRVLYDPLHSGGLGTYVADYDRVFERHETDKFRNGTARERETEGGVSPIATVSHEVQIFVDTFAGNGINLAGFRVNGATEDSYEVLEFVLPQVRMSDTPNTDITGGSIDRHGNNCTDVVSRPHVRDEAYLAHVRSAHSAALAQNIASESMGVLEQYAHSVAIGFQELERFFDRNGVPS